MKSQVLSIKLASTSAMKLKVVLRTKEANGSLGDVVASSSDSARTAAHVFNVPLNITFPNYLTESVSPFISLHSEGTIGVTKSSIHGVKAWDAPVSKTIGMLHSD